MSLGSEIRKNLFRIPDPGSRGQKGTGSRIRIRNTELEVNCVLCMATGRPRLSNWSGDGGRSELPGPAQGTGGQQEAAPGPRLQN